MLLLKYSSIKEINEEASRCLKGLQGNPKGLCREIKKWMNEGHESMKENRKEEAYTYFYRSMELFKRLKKIQAFIRNTHFYYGMIGGKMTLNDATIKLKKLREFLQEEYCHNKNHIQKESTTEEPSSSNKISVDELKKLKIIGNKRFLLCEIRDSKEYLKNHVNWEESLNIPPNRITSSMQLIDPFRYQPEYLEYLFIMDKNSKNFEENIGLINFRQLLSKWDWKGTVCPQLFLCEGGFETFSNVLPSDTTMKSSLEVSTYTIVNEDATSCSELNRSFIETPPPTPPLNCNSPAFFSGAISLSEKKRPENNSLSSNCSVCTLNLGMIQEVQKNESDTLTPNDLIDLNIFHHENERLASDHMICSHESCEHNQNAERIKNYIDKLLSEEVSRKLNIIRKSREQIL
ncbi:uncharacterized protein [Lepeophtheirus salmonis]|uniref:uncharacterized protein n=1 Tax=Lepeophtheirus salmonis TaxID=72036 RepID=UPI001AE1AF1A|nr:uncharacterized protein LOC121114260 [Lepeophtheirus salmonis]XP_040564108.1 uncharacterized protein LOC121114260 [Lepeophtheirus salmonis]